MMMLEDNSAGDHPLIVQWTGDISLNGRYCEPPAYTALAENLGAIRGRLGEVDLRIVNWESPLWGDGGVNTLKVPRLCTTRDAAQSIVSLGIDVALLANNHAYDCLEAGFANTIRFLDENGIRHLGAGGSEAEASAPLLLSRRGRRIGLLNYVACDTHPSLPEGAGVFLNMLDPERALREVAELAADCDAVLVHLHWGVDYFAFPTVWQRSFARRLIDSGATVVVGHHSHCLQGQEGWGKGHVFYGLGNLVFGNIDPSRPWPAASRRAAVAQCRLAGGQVRSATMIPFYLEGDLLREDESPARAHALQGLSKPLSLPDAQYARYFARRRMEYELVGKPIRFLRDAGGVIPALSRLRWRHLRRIGGLLKNRGG
mgnify:FL=1